MKRWDIAPADSAADVLARELCLSQPLAQVLINRGFREVEAGRQFLNPQLRALRDPFELPDMAAAVERILAAIKKHERIVIYGDYDVDGVTSSALLYRILRAAGAEVANFLPHRFEEGYGLSADGIMRCLEEHQPRLLVAVDCGTTAVAEISSLKSQGVDVVVLDHHEPAAELPQCVALVNPKRQSGDKSPHSKFGVRQLAGALPYLASVGVCFKLAHALLKAERSLAEKIDLREDLDLVAVGTVADIVPLVGENRILVKAGLGSLPGTKKVGLRALMDVAGVTGEVKPGHIGFRLGPRLNAAGRLADAMAALELLLTEDAGRAKELAVLLNTHNAERQQIEERIVAEALAQARQHKDDRVLVLADDNWHAGVIGIVASRVAQAFYRPTIIMGAAGKGSCRSIAGFSIVAALQACATLLERHGGHEMAAGLTLTPGRLMEFRKVINEYAGRELAEEDLQPRVAVDAVVRLDDLDHEFFQQLEKLEPCGLENPMPCFVALGLRRRGAARVLKGKHLKFNVTDGDTACDAVWWNAGDQTLPAEEFDLAFVPEINAYRGAESVQLRVRDVRSPSQPGRS